MAAIVKTTVWPGASQMGLDIQPADERSTVLNHHELVGPNAHTGPDQKTLYIVESEVVHMTCDLPTRKCHVSIVTMQTPYVTDHAIRPRAFWS